jgi:hypothetical protein
MEQSQQRMNRHAHQQDMLRQMRPGSEQALYMRGIQNGINFKGQQGALARTAMANNQK